MTTPDALPHHAVRALRATMHGTVLTEGDAGYGDRCAGWNILRTHHPAVVVAATDVSDVVAAVRFAIEHEMGLGVQCTGHGMAVPVDGVLVDTSGLSALSVDARRRTARIGAGCTWGAVLQVTHPHGLAPLLGSSPTVGAVGYTLGGGLGWLARKHGAACDAVRSFEVVTPDGQVCAASTDEHPELFRALRGGGGAAFGVVTAMEIDLVAVGQVYAGNLYYPPEAAGELAEAYADWVAEQPDDLTSALVCMNVPPAPHIPEDRRGRPFVMLRGCWSGDLDEGRATLDGWRAGHRPVVDCWDTMAFSECASISEDRAEPTPAVVAGEWLSRLDHEVGAQLAHATFAAAGRPPLLRFSEVRHLGGAVARSDRAASSLGHRDFPFLLSMVGTADSGAGSTTDGGAATNESTDGGASEIREHQRAVLASLGGAATGAAYLNSLEGNERRTRTGAAFEPADRSRLAELQQRLDPGGLLRYGVDHVGSEVPGAHHHRA